MKKIPLILLILFLGSAALAQHGSHAYRKHGDTQYKHHHYQSAIGYYMKALKKAPDPGNIMLQIAKCYNRINQPVEAENWFLQANKNKAAFTIQDYYQYARILVTLKKRSQADALLEQLVASDPNNNLARKALSDLRDFEKYYVDSTGFLVDTLSINSTVAEFAPAYYKDGIVFSSARLEGILRKKYHWDNTHFLNLYVSHQTTPKHFTSPELFEKDLNTKYHEGPAMFYAQNRRMILNRNQTVRVVGSEDAYERRLALYDGIIDEAKSTWRVTPLPFNDPAYSYAHPSISESGDTLYFVSDQPGGYGGSDIYRVVRKNGVWGKHFNLGPAVNSAENEVFPFFIDNVLYFASNGHGGLGGLDLFESRLTVNGFSPPANMGYPMNTPADDFSLITRMDQRNGYFASARKGNDDIYYFEKLEEKIEILAHIYDSLTQKPLSGANIQVITNNGNDSTLIADNEGNFKIELPKETAYVIIGTKDDKIGMVSDMADKSKSHRIPALGDSSSIACIGFIVNEEGLPKKASTVSIVDTTTGEKIEFPGDTSQLAFLGKKGHSYHIEVADDAGHTASHDLNIALTDKDPKSFTIVLPDSQPLDMSAKIFRGDNNTPVPNANVRIITFADEDKELISDENGIVDFKLKEGTAFVIVGTKDNLTGMLSEMAERGKTDKATQTLPVPLYADKNDVTVIGLVTNTSGDAVEGFKATVTNKVTGDNIPVDIKPGLMTFKGDHGESYNIAVSHEDYKTTLQEVILPQDGPDVHKFNVILEGQNDGFKKVLPLASVESNKIADNIKTGKSELLMVDTDKGTTKAFILSGNTLTEITERDSLLYHETPRGNEYLAKGELGDLRRNPSSVLKGVQKTDVTKLRNIYFDFDKSDLDADDEKYLLQVKSILERDNTTKLIIAGHADDRGTDDYNVRLSLRRVQSVEDFLVGAGVPQGRIVRRAYGESLPVVPCHGDDCTEQQHQLNRRAEFVISQDEIIPETILPKAGGK
jgi:outer membrane protein OmpA-like peptidoglycan-associated protein/tetratricopeptide (TPR) repeat protein